jgi:hypothetical protein
MAAAAVVDRWPPPTFPVSSLPSGRCRTVSVGTESRQFVVEKSEGSGFKYSKKLSDAPMIGVPRNEETLLFAHSPQHTASSSTSHHGAAKTRMLFSHQIGNRQTVRTLLPPRRLRSTHILQSLIAASSRQVDFGGPWSRRLGLVGSQHQHLQLHLVGKW